MPGTPHHTVVNADHEKTKTSFIILTFAAPSYGSSPAKGLFRFWAKSSQARTANENTSAGREYRPGTNTSGAKNERKN